MYNTASCSFLFIHSRPDRIAAHVGIVKTFAKYLEGTVQSCKIASHVHGVLTEAIHDYYMGMAWGEVVDTYYLHIPCIKRKTIITPLGWKQEKMQNAKQHTRFVHRNYISES